MTFAVGAEYDLGHHGATARGQQTSLVLHRLAGSILIDATIIRHLHTYARFAPGAIYLHGAIEDAALPERPLVSDAWTWAVDTTGGIAVLLGAVGADEAPAVGFWVTAEVGYCFTGEAQMSYAPEADGDDGRVFGSTRLPNVRPGGVVNRFALGISF
jgi:Zn-dependent protease